MQSKAELQREIDRLKLEIEDDQKLIYADAGSLEADQYERMRRSVKTHLNIKLAAARAYMLALMGLISAMD